MVLRVFTTALTVATIVLQVPRTEPRFVDAPCRTPLGMQIAIAEPGLQRDRQPHVIMATESRWDPVHLPLPALFVATPIVVQGRVVRVGPQHAERDGTWLTDADIDVDVVVKNRSAVPITRRVPLRVTVPDSYRGVAFSPAPVVLSLGRRSLWLLKPGRRGVEFGSEAAQAIDVDGAGRLTLQPHPSTLPAGVELAAAHDLMGLCARMHALFGGRLDDAGDVDRALLRWAGIDTPARQRVYAAQMRRNADAIALYLFFAQTKLVRVKDRTFPSALCRADDDRALPTPRSPVPCMSYAAMNERINPGGRFIYP